MFAGDITSTSRLQTVQKLGVSLEAIVQRYAHPRQQLRSPIEVLLLHAGTRDDISLLDLHEVYHPWDETLGWDYWKVFSNEAEILEPGNGSAYDKYGLDEEHGCLVILRPDQHVSYVGSLHEHEAPALFFEKILRPTSVQ